jgi:hypothetical protein
VPSTSPAAASAVLRHHRWSVTCRSSVTRRVDRDAM